MALAEPYPVFVRAVGAADAALAEAAAAAFMEYHVAAAAGEAARVRDLANLQDDDHAR